MDMTLPGNRLCRTAMLFGLALVFPCIVAAQEAVKDRSQWADPDRKRWFESQMMNDATRQRLGVHYRSCCDAGDVVKNLRWRLMDDGTKYGSERWQYLDNGTWKTIHPDIIQNTPSIDEEPILFRNKNDGRELCFLPPKGGT
jgi:hypothetical protein